MELVNSGYRDITIIEKEETVGQHASGRNSGVLHAGIYYSPDSLKAKFCLQGNLLMKQYCREKGIRVFESGKVIVAQNAEEAATLKELYDRAVKNGARVDLIDENRLREIEPNTKSHGMALYSHDTAVVDPMEILHSLIDTITASKGVTISWSTSFAGLAGSNVARTSKGTIAFEKFINTAGAYCDKVAHAFGVGHEYKLIPFKGIYRKLRKEKAEMVRGNIYPVPNIRNPFLGIHFTKKVNGDVYIGPTAIPALGRENYGIVSGMDFEAFDILAREAALFFTNRKFRDVALAEPRKYVFKYFFDDAKRLVNQLEPSDVVSSNKVGIRPQLVDWKRKELVMDFLVIEDGASIHVLNAISPAFTSSMHFAKYIVQKYVSKQHQFE
ncbi:MAG: L-2-hydroxyglutarate oxidase [Nitrospirae bacterium]|nr:L-2-hydroxyglutarate oxidase [Nitrospirota bacterium]